MMDSSVNSKNSSESRTDLKVVLALNLTIIKKAIQLPQPKKDLNTSVNLINHSRNIWLSLDPQPTFKDPNYLNLLLNEKVNLNILDSPLIIFLLINNMNLQSKENQSIMSQNIQIYLNTKIVLHTRDVRVVLLISMTEKADMSLNILQAN